MFIACDVSYFSSSVRCEMCRMSLLTELKNKRAPQAINISLLTELLFQRLVSPAANAHHVEAFAREDNLFNCFAAAVAFALEIIANLHPSNFTTGITDDEEDGKGLAHPVGRVVLMLDLSNLDSIALP